MNTFNEQDWRRHTDGQFAGRVHTGPEIALAPDAIEARRAVLEAAGYTQVEPEVRLPYQTAKTTDWWAQVGPEPVPGDYPVMTRDLPEGGRAYLKRYAGGEVDLRMPSVSSIRRYADAHGSTFDVPVSAVTPAGHGKGHVRVTYNGDGRWSVSCIGIPGEAAAYVAESVSAVLEARRPTQALAVTRDILRRRRERIAAGGVKVKPVDSVWIRGIGYNEQDGQMVIQLGKHVYGYRVPREVYEEVRSAPSPGAAYNRLVKGKSRGKFRVVQHEACGNFYDIMMEHRCPSRHEPPKKLATV